jgi:predicted acylesterase/phospholipase RssA
VSALDANAPRPTVFRSYAGENVRPSKCAIWQAARATSAAPSFFKEMFIDIPPPGISYIDGGLGYNNPAELALGEAAELWPASTNICLLSIGTGRQTAAQGFDRPGSRDIEVRRSRFERLLSYLPDLEKSVPNWKTVKRFSSGVVALMGMASALTSIVTSSEEVHQRLSEASKLHGNPFPYYRFNVERSIGDIGFEDWKKKGAIHSHTLAYLGEHDTKERRIECVKSLMEPPPFNCK